MFGSRITVAFAILCLVTTDLIGQSDDILSQSGFGASVAIAGNEIFVGEPNNLRIPGRVYVFRKEFSTGDWVSIGEFSSRAATPGDGFGKAVAASGSLLVVSEIGDGHGRIHLYERGPTAEWRERSTVDTAGVEIDGLLGEALATDDRRVFTTIRDEQGIQVVEFEVPGSDYSSEVSRMSRIGHIKVPDRESAVSLAFGGGKLYVGTNETTMSEGWIRTFEERQSTWVQTDSLRLTDLRGSDDEGLLSSIAVFGDSNRLLTGFPKAANEAGVVVVVQSHSLEGDHPAGATIDRLSARLLEEDAEFGAAVAAMQHTAVVGAPFDLFGYGAAFVYERETPDDAWGLVQSLKPDFASGYPSIIGRDVQCEDGEAAGFFCKNVQLASFLNISSLGLGPGMQTNDVWGWTDPDTDKEYAIVCSLHATTFIDVTDPNNPIVLGTLPATPGTRPNWWRDAKTYGHYAYIVADNVGDHGLQIFDLLHLRDVENPPVTFEPTAHYDGFDSAHNIIINEETGMAYVVGINGGGKTCGGGSHILDLKDPLKPKFMGCFAHPGTNAEQEGATHDAQCVLYHGPDERYTGREICIASNVDAISIADFTDKENIVPIAAARYPNSSYTHQGWLTEDHRYFYQNDETDEINGLTDGTRTLIWDFAELDDPILVNEFVLANKATDHNYFISGHYLYESNYVSGLRILDISDVENPVEVGFFDTVPWGDDEPGFGGSWSNYPFFKSGTIAVTSMEEGVFFLKREEIAP